MSKARNLSDLLDANNALRDLPETYPNALLQHNEDYTDMVWTNVTWPTRPE